MAGLDPAIYVFHRMFKALEHVDARDKPGA